MQPARAGAAEVPRPRAHEEGQPGEAGGGRVGGGAAAQKRSGDRATFDISCAAPIECPTTNTREGSTG